MADTPTETENEQTLPTLFITGADNGVGLAVATQAVKAGCKVVGTTTMGTAGAYRIRRAGGIPVYPDLTRESAVYSALQMAKADMVIHAAPQLLNGIPQAVVDYDEELAWLQTSTEAVMSAAGRADVKRLIMVSAANAYADSHGESITEDAALDTTSPYGKAIHAAEEAVLDGGIPGYVLRTGYIIGSTNTMGAVMLALREGKNMPAGTHSAAWATDDDIAQAIMAIIGQETDESVATVYNIASQETTTPSDFMRLFGDEYGVGEPGNLPDFLLQLRTHAVTRALLEKSVLLDTSKAQEALGWSPQGTIAGAIDKFLLMMRMEESADMLPAPTTGNSDSQDIVKA